jgi:hypothetical protein
MSFGIKNVQASPLSVAPQQTASLRRTGPSSPFLDTLTSYSKAEQNGACMSCAGACWDFSKTVFRMVRILAIYMQAGCLFLAKGAACVINLMHSIYDYFRKDDAPPSVSEEEIRFAIAASKEMPKEHHKDIILGEIVYEAVKKDYPFTDEEMVYIFYAFESEIEREKAKETMIAFFREQRRCLRSGIFTDIDALHARALIVKCIDEIKTKDLTKRDELLNELIKSRKQDNPKLPPDAAALMIDLFTSRDCKVKAVEQFCIFFYQQKRHLSLIAFANIYQLTENYTRNTIVDALASKKDKNQASKQINQLFQNQKKDVNIRPRQLHFDSKEIEKNQIDSDDFYDS